MGVFRDVVKPFNYVAVPLTVLLVFFQKAKDVRGDSRRLKQPRRCGSRGADLKRKGVEGQAGKPHRLAVELEGPGCAVAAIAYHGMAGEPGMAPDLMLSPCHEVALNEGITGASPEDEKAGHTWRYRARAFGMEAAASLFCQGPSPDPPAVFRVRFGEFSVEECDVTLPDLVAFELPCEVAEGLWLAGQ